KYFKHFMGPVWWLAPLMIPIEIVSHLARPVSLAMRLLGNIAADHAVVLAFFAIVPFLVPVPFLVMGVFVSVVQAVVFSLLTTVYIGRAVAHEEHYKPNRLPAKVRTKNHPEQEPDHHAPHFQAVRFPLRPRRCRRRRPHRQPGVRAGGGRRARRPRQVARP